MAKIATLQEDWRSGQNSSTVWAGFFGVTSVVSNHLNFTVSSGATNYNGFNSLNSFSLVDSYIFQQVINAGNQALVSLECYIVQLQLDGNNKVTWYLNQNILKCYKTVATVRTQVGSNLAYVAGTHVFFRIRETNGVVYWDYSQDGIDWTNYTSETVANLFAITSLHLALAVGTSGTEASGSTVIYGAVNYIYANSPGNIGDGSILKTLKVGDGMSVGSDRI